MSNNFTGAVKIDSYTSVYQSPLDVEIFFDDEAAFDMIRQVKSRKPASCPRCKSVYIKEINTTVFRELSRCLDCGYMFNALSGTIFQSSKLPMKSHMRMMLIYDLLGQGIDIATIVFNIGVSQKTASNLLKKFSGYETRISYCYAANDVEAPSSQRVQHKYPPTTDNFAMFCSMIGVRVNLDLMQVRLGELLFGADG